MIVLKQSLSIEEIQSIINEESRISKINNNYDPSINLVLLTNREKMQLANTTKAWDFYVEHILECKGLETKIYKLFESRDIEYALVYEGSYHCFFRFFIEEKEFSFESLFELFIELSNRYNETFFTFQILFNILQDELCTNEIEG